MIKSGQISPKKALDGRHCRDIQVRWILKGYLWRESARSEISVQLFNQRNAPILNKY